MKIKLRISAGNHVLFGYYVLIVQKANLEQKNTGADLCDKPKLVLNCFSHF